MTQIKDEGFSVTLDAPGYYSLAAVLERAFKQASEGKGKERHANDLPFDQQPMQTIAGAHGVGFLTGQAAKKSQEALGLPHDRKVAELLGAINYLAGAVLFLEAQNKPVATPAIDLEFPLGSAYMTGSGEVGVVSKSDAKKYAASSSGIVEALPPLHNRRKDDVPANDNWVDWNGGPIPVPHSRLVEILKRDGGRIGGEKAGAFRWLHSDGSSYMSADGDIVAYRVVAHG